MFDTDGLKRVKAGESGTKIKSCQDSCRTKRTHRVAEQLTKAEPRHSSAGRGPCPETIRTSVQQNSAPSTPDYCIDHELTG